MATSFTPPVSTPAAAPAAPAPVSTPAAAPAASIEHLSEGDLTPTLIADELSEALDAPLPDPPAETPPPAAPKAATPPAAEPKVDAADPDPEAPPAADAAPPVPDPAAPPAPAQLPEGVKLRTIDGKQAWVMDPKAGESLAARAGLVESAEAILGGPLTEDVLKYHQKVSEGFEGMRGDLLSDDPADQAHVAAHLENVIKDAQGRGEIGHDALSGFARIVIDRALSGDPGTAAAVEKHITRTVIDRLYDEALRTHDPAQAKILWSSAAQADKASFGEYRPLTKFEEGRKAAPPARFQPRQAPAPAAEAAAPPEARAQHYESWVRDSNTKIHTEAVGNSVDTALADIPQEQRKQFPRLFDSTRDQLFKEVRTGIKSDSQLQSQIRILQQRAQRAVNADLRNQYADQIVRRCAARASQILKDKKGPILSEYANLVAAKSSDQTRRVTAGAQAGRNAAPGGGPSASRSNPQVPKTTKFESGDDQALGKELEEALAG